MFRKHVPKTYAAKFSNSIKKRIGTNRPQSWSGKGGSTSKYGGNKTRRKGNR